ncbi:MAG: DUF4367 domain-containing protein [Negativicutes bacterium]|nr:DUF4367 domain-containing protein [Negativicutes bacterium]
MNEYKPVPDIPELTIRDALLLNEAAKVIVQRRAAAFDTAMQAELSPAELQQMQRKIHTAQLQQSLLALGKRTAMVTAGLLFVILLGVGGYQQVEAFRLIVNDVYYQVFPQYTEYHFQNEDEALQNANDNSTNPASQIARDRRLELKSGGVLSWGELPAGYKLDTITDTVASVSIIFRNSSDKISFQLLPTSAGVVLDTEDAEVSDIELSESRAQLICKGDSVSLLWLFDQKMYVLVATNLEKETLIAFAESIKISYE